jgi:hypothetical protein
VELCELFDAEVGEGWGDCLLGVGWGVVVVVVVVVLWKGEGVKGMKECNCRILYSPAPGMHL